MPSDLTARIDALRKAIDEAVSYLNAAWTIPGGGQQFKDGVTVLQEARTADDIAQGRDWPPVVMAEAVAAHDSGASRHSPDCMKVYDCERGYDSCETWQAHDSGAVS